LPRLSQIQIFNRQAGESDKHSYSDVFLPEKVTLLVLQKKMFFIKILMEKNIG